MTTAAKLEKARLIEMEADFANPKSGGKTTIVQFNPESLKVTFANQLVQPGNGGANGTGDQSNQAGRQFVGAGTTKLALQLWFDVGSQDADSGDRKADVRDLTKDVAFFITPKQEGSNYLPPAVRFSWGSFHFDGYFDSLEENLDFFSTDGIPLRASMSVNMSQQKIQEFSGSGGSLNAPPGAPGFSKGGLGTSPLAAARSGASLQSMVSAGQDWKSIASANNIENPRSLDPGQWINLNLRSGSSG